MAQKRKDTVIDARTRHKHLTHDEKRKFYHRERLAVKKLIRERRDEDLS